MNSYTIAVTYIVEVEAPDDETAVVEAMEKVESDQHQVNVEIKSRKS
jgi:hypothetical protein